MVPERPILHQLLTRFLIKYLDHLYRTTYGRVHVFIEFGLVTFQNLMTGSFVLDPAFRMRFPLLIKVPLLWTDCGAETGTYTGLGIIFDFVAFFWHIFKKYSDFRVCAQFKASARSEVGAPANEVRRSGATSTRLWGDADVLKGTSSKPRSANAEMRQTR